MRQSGPAFLLCSSGALHEAGKKDMYTSVFHYAGTDFLKKTCQIFQNFQKDLGEEGDKSTNNLQFNTMSGLAEVLKQPHSHQG